MSVQKTIAVDLRIPQFARVRAAYSNKETCNPRATYLKLGAGQCMMSFYQTKVLLKIKGLFTLQQRIGNLVLLLYSLGIYCRHSSSVCVHFPFACFLSYFTLAPFIILHIIGTNTQSGTLRRNTPCEGV